MGPGPRLDESPEPQEHRRYSEDEVAEILKRTAGLERRKQLERPNLSLSEIESIARESGMDASLVRQAVRDMQNERATKAAKGWAGAPVRRTFERVVEGELTTGQAERVAADILEATRLLAPMGGQLNAIGRTITWSGWTSGGMVSVSVTPRDGKTNIRVDINSSQIAGGVFGGIIGGVGGGLGANVAWMLPALAHLPLLAGLVGAGGVVFGAYWLARAIYTFKVSGVHQSMEQLIDQVESRLRTTLSAG